MDPIATADGRQRCPWPGTDPLYRAYHDEEWGVPETDDRALFEKLALDAFQAGLSWLVILRKREGFRRAFAGFDPTAIARFGPADVDQLMTDAAIVRNRAKIEATIAGARAWLTIIEREGSFSRLLWDVVDGRMRVNSWRTSAEVPAQTAESRRLAALLRDRGFRFVGPTVCYAFMQATGMVNDHLTGCFRHEPCARRGRGADDRAAVPAGSPAFRQS